MIVNRLTVDGKDYFLPDPVTELREKIKAAVQAGGDYVNIPPLRSGPGVDILFSPGMPVVWTQIDVGGEGASENAATVESDSNIEDDSFGSL
ncbi:hypothetical protein [Diaminobutyricibacter sp. McL0608]|uniref:hypothetical protein n=1 Tax=Leifsonia sp. McL0608 TaxID=3143537 RepID=UPI0031F310A1